MKYNKWIILMLLLLLIGPALTRAAWGQGGSLAKNTGTGDLRIIRSPFNINNIKHKVPGGSTIIFYDDVRGTGDFTGKGTVIFRAGFYPGHSPGVVNFGGDVIFGSSSVLEIEVNWQSKGLIDNVILEYSINNGANWTPIDTVANTGFYLWQVPAHNSQQCLFRITDTGDPTVTDASDAVFTIFICTLSADLTGDCYVSVIDLGVFVGQWLMSDNPFDCPLSAELAGSDCFVNLADFAVLAGEWLTWGNPFGGPP